MKEQQKEHAHEFPPGVTHVKLWKCTATVPGLQAPATSISVDMDSQTFCSPGVSSAAEKKPSCSDPDWILSSVKFQFSYLVVTVL